MLLESTQRRTEGTDQAHELLGRAVDELQSTIQEVRTAIFALQQPPAEAPTSLRGRVLRETAAASAVLGFQPSTHFQGPVDTVVPDPVATHLVAALRRALTTASGRADVSRVEITIDVTTSLPDGRDAVRLRVYDDGRTGDGDSGGTTVRWQSPL